MAAKSKIIKLNGRYKLYKDYGLSHAVKFRSWSTEAGKMEQFLRESYGSEYSWNSHHQWKTHWGKSKDGGPRPYYIGVRDEEMIFMAKLAGVL